MQEEKLNEYSKYGLEEEIVLRLISMSSSPKDKERLYDITTKSKVNWEKIVGILVCNRIAGVAYKKTERLEVFSCEINRALKAIFEAQKARSLTQFKEVRLIGNTLANQGIKFCFLKGAILNTIIYEPGERVSNDTDILIDKMDIDKCLKVLESMDYVQGNIQGGKIIEATKKEKLFARINTYEVLPMYKKMNNTFMPIHAVDINFRLDNADNGLASKIFLNDSPKTKNKAIDLKTVEIEKIIIFLGIHLYREAIMPYKIMNGNDLALYKFLDIHYIIAKYKEHISFEKIYEIASEIERLKDVYYAFYYTEKLFPKTFETDILDKFKPRETDYLNQYKGKDNTQEIYTWKEPFESRVFNCARIEEARNNIEAEEVRRKDIMNLLGDKNDSKGYFVKK